MSSYLSLIKKKFDEIFTYWIEKDAKDELEREMQVMYTEGSVAQLKLNFLSSYLGDHFEQVYRSLSQLQKSIKKKASEQVALKEIIAHNRRKRRNSMVQRDPI